ncbi:DUF1501 domain-containing protein [Vannielia litorea]|uniref:Uncharacterized conserved protein, DUF1501 family n=1 Tax=Vannielia litorea TaxID=1217970 RepID=A0A1N6GNH4_9RHOB|nr:DUF1501 domain-containing protein [Vannielia litorea]SIO09076.1 Uncharacterized conserved protein, DUF1501 family [Vannielia litorea]
MSKLLMTRRRFLATTGCSVAASPLLTPMAFASAPWDTRLVVLILRGAMDGLDVVRPVGDPSFAATRPTLAAGDGLPLDGFFTLHPALAPLHPLWAKGELGFAHAVSTPYRDKRSHFDGQDLLEAGTGFDVTTGAARDGWLNRMLQAVPGLEADTAYAIGREELLLLAGAAPVANWSPGTRLELSPQARRLIELVYEEHPVYQAAVLEALELTEDIAAAEALRAATGEDEADTEMQAMMDEAPGNAAHMQMAEFAVDRLRGDTRIAAFSLGGWDTHGNQANTLPRALRQLSDVIGLLHAGLGPLWGKTGVLAMTEFGRTVRENGSRGTDHGTGGLMVMAGGALRGGKVHGRWPGLEEAALYDRRDLMPTEDVRAYAARAMEGLFGLSGTVLSGSVFPGLDFSAAPRLVF